MTSKFRGENGQQIAVSRLQTHPLGWVELPMLSQICRKTRVSWLYVDKRGETNHKPCRAAVSRKLRENVILDGSKERLCLGLFLSLTFLPDNVWYWVSSISPGQASRPIFSHVGKAPGRPCRHNVDETSRGAGARRQHCLLCVCQPLSCPSHCCCHRNEDSMVPWWGPGHAEAGP